MPGILFISNFISSKTGRRSIAEDLSEHLKKPGWQIFTTSNQMQPATRLMDMITTAVKHKDLYQVACVDVYSGRAFIWAEIISYFLKRLNKSYILCLHGGGLPDFSNRWPGRVRRLLRSANKVITPSHYIKNNLSAYRTDIRYLPNAIDVAEYPFRLRRDPSPKLCWLRAMHAVYEPTLAVKVLAILRNSFPNVKLDMIGGDEGDGTLLKVVQLSKQYGLENNINIVGAISKQDVPHWLNKSDIFLNTTRFESFGVSVIEAGSVGLCIVTTNAGELPYLWQHEYNALLITPGDEDAMASLVSRVLSEPGLSTMLSMNAREKAEGFDWAIILPQWEQLINELCNSSN